MPLEDAEVILAVRRDIPPARIELVEMKVELDQKIREASLKFSNENNKSHFFRGVDDLLDAFARGKISRWAAGKIVILAIGQHKDDRCCRIYQRP